jgi:Uma2 family endonuclease
MSLLLTQIADAEDEDRLYTADELLALSARDDNRYELIHGRLRIMPPAGDEHGFLAASLNARIFLHVEEHKLGYVFAAETGFYLSRNPDLVRAPDVAFVRSDRVLEKFSGRYFPNAPDLAVEVVSPNDTLSEVQDKIQDWLTYGARLVWVVDPKTRTVTVYRPDGTANVLKAKDTLDGEDVLPGFAFPLSRLFGE